jgi:hypothetical protein
VTRSEADRSRELISKLEAARRQLRTAVALFFDHGDDIAIHTLTAAGRQILLDLLKQQGKRTRLQTSAEIVVKAEYQKLYRDAVARAENFFKHADRDPNVALTFDARETHVLLFEAADAYQALTGRHLRELWMFMMWFLAEYPTSLNPGTLKDLVMDSVNDPSFDHRDRRRFRAAFERAALPAKLD